MTVIQIKYENKTIKRAMAKQYIAYAFDVFCDKFDELSGAKAKSA